jgi:hypothetical protein
VLREAGEGEFSYIWGGWRTEVVQGLLGTGLLTFYYKAHCNQSLHELAVGWVWTAMVDALGDDAGLEATRSPTKRQGHLYV